MGKFIDITGLRFGRLTVLEDGGVMRYSDGRSRHVWTCKCDCGNIVSVLGDNLRCGYTSSCGCLKNERTVSATKKHGRSDSRLYNVWRAIKSRCFNQNVATYRLYGGRGITMCDEWKDNYVAFEKWALENGYDETSNRGVCTIDRIDNDGNYCPSNCRVVSQVEQMNNVSYNKNITYKDETHTVAEWARIYSIPYSVLYQRVFKYNMKFEDAVLFHQ